MGTADGPQISVSLFEVAITITGTHRPLQPKHKILHLNASQTHFPTQIYTFIIKIKHQIVNHHTLILKTLHKHKTKHLVRINHFHSFTYLKTP